MSPHLSSPMRKVLALIDGAGTVSMLPKTRTVSALEMRGLVTVAPSLGRRDPDTGDLLCRVSITDSGRDALKVPA